jgi:hypothetical protein
MHLSPYSENNNNTSPARTVLQIAISELVDSTHALISCLFLLSMIIISAETALKSSKSSPVCFNIVYTS